MPEAPPDGVTYGRLNGTTWTGVLPLTGGTVAGPLNYTATGGTTMRDARDRAAEVVNVKDFGAKGDGVTDDTAAVTAAAAAVAANGGGVLYFPAGRYLMSGAVYLASNTTARGDGPASIMLGSANWVFNGNFPNGQYCFLTNVNAAGSYASSTLTDHDIVVEDLQFDYGAFGPVHTPDGSTHQVRFVYASNVTVRNCTFQVRGQGDAVAMLGTYNSMITDCTAYGFSNCAWDHWNSPTKGRVISCYAETTTSAQMVNWNPDGGVTWVAQDFLMSNCEFHATSGSAVPLQLEPLQLGPGSTPGVVSDVLVTGCLFRNACIVTRGATSNVVISGNIFASPQGGGGVIAIYPQFGGNPANVAIIGNVIVNPTTTPGNEGVINVQTSSAVIAGNAILGTTFTDYSLYTVGYAPVVSGNYFGSPGVNSSASKIQNHPVNGLTLDAGITFGAAGLASAETDLSLGVILFDGGAGNQMGLSASWPGSGNSHLQFVTGINSDHTHMINGSTRFVITPAGFGFNGAAAVAQPTVTGSRGGNAALASLISALAAYGLITDSSTA